MPFKNRIRLPIYTRTPQFPTEATRFRLADGSSKTLAVTIKKTYEILTDYMGELMHQRLVIALNHDDVTIEGDKYIGDVTVDGEYQIDWPQWIEYPLGQAKVLVQVSPFDATNSNCQSCDVLSQLNLVDDEIGEIAEGAAETVGVYGNDEICCFPVTAEITWYDSGYLDSATIDQATGTATLTAKNPAPSVGNIKLATYRVTCPDGNYDEADIYGSIAGTEPACEQPSNFEAIVYSSPPPPFTATIEWNDPTPMPSGGFLWHLYSADSPVIPLQSGASTDYTAELTDLAPSTEYKFYVLSVCGEGVYSPWTELIFTTPASDLETCGNFNVIVDDGTPYRLNNYPYSYMDCNGVIQNRIGLNGRDYDICMLMDEFNQPVYFQADDPYFTVNYTAPC